MKVADENTRSPKSAWTLNEPVVQHSGQSSSSVIPPTETHQTTSAHVDTTGSHIPSRLFQIQEYRNPLDSSYRVRLSVTIGDRDVLAVSRSFKRTSSARHDALFALLKTADLEQFLSAGHGVNREAVDDTALHRTKADTLSSLSKDPEFEQLMRGCQSLNSMRYQRKLLQTQTLSQQIPKDRR